METVKEILECCRSYTKSKKDFVVIGSTALYLHGLQKSKPNDIDIVVNNLEGLKGNIIPYSTLSVFSTSGRRAGIVENGVTQIDVFIEDFLPDYKIIDDIRVATLSDIELYYKNLLRKGPEPWMHLILQKIMILNYGK